MLDTDPRLIRLIMSLRNQGIRDTAVLAAIERVPRVMFINPALASRAYGDHALPIECGQTISQPYIVAYMTEKLELNDRLKILEIGTGSGYQAAVLSHLCRRVYTIERYRTLLREAEKRFSELRITNITSMVGDGLKGWPAQAPFDRIIVTAAARETPRDLAEQLKPGGKMIFPLNTDNQDQELVLLVKTDDGYEQKPLIPVRFVPLVAGVAQEM
ncbi:MAG TPA: protein-L-isoaspartate(D-aspartate) O-methyltransferase [Rhizobiales bacterium]|nr:protein-L-isoaspartate(D-aspartate) O-methyltransferase [Hyphomicrobiales bacterium]